MDLSEVARMIAALAFVLGLIGVAAVLGRKYAPGALMRLKPATERRLQVVESLVLDPSRRLVLVRFDRQERLLLLGEGRVLAEHAAPETGAGSPSSSEAAAADPAA